MAYDVEKLHKIENALRTTAGLVGKSSDSLNEDGFRVGLGLTNEETICQKAADAVKDGVFKTIVMGTFNNGKSTIINALIGSKVLPEAATPATAIISYIRYGGEDKKIFVYNTDGTIKEMTTESFYETYKFTKEDAAECKVTGKVSRFENVDYSVVYCDKQLLANGVQIIDSPGLEDKACATKLTLQSASNANAIIYTGSVPSGGFNINDQSFFKSNFEGRHLNNIFFLINKSDFHDDFETLQEVKDYFKEQLKDVFTDDNGVFDESLYNKRVFFISAKNVLEHKTGEYSKKYDDRDLPEFQKFEKELEEFLTTDARSIATFNSCFAKIANAYKAAIHTAELNKAAKGKGVEDVNEDIAKAEAKLAQMEVELDSLRKSFTVAQTKTQSIFEKQMNGIVDNINDTWDVEMSRIVENSGFSTVDLMQIAWQAVRYINNEEKRNEAFAKKVEPITSGVQRFITKKVEEASSDIVLLTKPVVKQLSEDIKQTQLKLDGLFKDIYTLFNVDDANVKKGDVNIFKLLTSMSNTDPNLMIEVLAGNDIGWADFLKRTLVEIFMDTLLFSLIGGPIGLALFVLKEWWALKNGRNHMASDLARKSKDGLISDLRKKIEERSELMYSKINKEYDLEFNRISKDVRAKIAEERNLLEDMKKKLNNAQFDYASEIDRCEYIINRIWKTAHAAYAYVFEKELAKESFELFIKCTLIAGAGCQGYDSDNLHKIQLIMEVQLFEKYWKNYNDAIASLIIRRANLGRIDIDTINNEIKTYSRRWQNDKNVEGLWLQELKEENPIKADAIQQIISNIELKAETFEAPSMIKYYVCVAVISALSIFIVLVLSLSWWKAVLIPILCTMLAYGFLIPQGNSKRELAISSVAKKYVMQIDGFKNRIDRILSE